MVQAILSEKTKNGTLPDALWQQIVSTTDAADAACNDRRWTDATDLYRTVLRAAPGCGPEIWTRYGRALREIGRLVQAREAFRRALSLDPGAADALLEMANLPKPKSDLLSADSARIPKKKIESPTEQTTPLFERKRRT
jgi:Flp pilus assembly protein TadD